MSGLLNVTVMLCYDPYNGTLKPMPGRIHSTRVSDEPAVETFLRREQHHQLWHQHKQGCAHNTRIDDSWDYHNWKDRQFDTTEEPVQQHLWGDCF